MENFAYAQTNKDAKLTWTAEKFLRVSSSCKIDGTAHNVTRRAFTALATEASHKVAEELRLGLGPGNSR